MHAGGAWTIEVDLAHPCTGEISQEPAIGSRYLKCTYKLDGQLKGASKNIFLPAAGSYREKFQLIQESFLEASRSSQAWELVESSFESPPVKGLAVISIQGPRRIP